MVPRLNTPSIAVMASSIARPTFSRVVPSTSSSMGQVFSHHRTSHKAVHTSAPSTVSTPSNAHYDTANPRFVRKYLRTYGLTPPRVESYEIQKMRCLAQLALKTTDIDKFLYLSTIRKNNVHLFYRLLIDHLKELTPLIYTPTVGEACVRWSEIYQQHEGMYLSFEDRGNLASIIQNWPQPNVEMSVVTDGSRILGLGDLGINGMGIPIGKLALYTGCAGIHPEATLPLTLDLGTSNKAFREDPLYMGSRRPKVTALEEEEFIDELMAALTERWPGIVIQFEDFKNPFPTLERHQNTYTCFNDDIQGTGAVILGGIINAVRRSGIPSRSHRAVFLGAGSAGVGVAKQIVEFFIREGMTEDEARSCFYLVDSKGLVTSDRGDKLADHKIYFSRTDNGGQQFRTLEDVVDHVKPTILMGLSTIGGAFTPNILTKMAGWSEHPIIFPLSNPSSKSECTFEAAVTHTQGRALFASGSPFQPFTFTDANGSTKTYYPGQGNNMYVFPGIGLGTILSKSVMVTQGMIYASGEALSKALTPEEVELGLLYPNITRIREVSVVVGREVIRASQKEKVDRETLIKDLSDPELDAWIVSKMYDPHGEVESIEREVESLMASSQPMGDEEVDEKRAKL